MGARGPQPTPTAIRVLRGGKADPNEVQPRPGQPEPPAWLSSRGLEVWNHTLKELIHMQVVTPADRDLLAIYCQSVANYAEAVEVLNLHGPLSVGQKGEVVKNPVMQVVRDQALLVKLYGAQFGLTPASRVGLVAVGEPESKAGPERLLS